MGAISVQFEGKLYELPYYSESHQNHDVYYVQVNDPDLQKIAGEHLLFLITQTLPAMASWGYLNPGSEREMKFKQAIASAILGQ
jgi:hypothetical protein